MIEAKKLDLYFRDHKILDQISIKLPKGSLSYIWGPNGSGKSTLLKALAGLENPIEFSLSGEISYDGQLISKINSSERAKKILYVSGRVPVHFSVPVRDFLSLGAMGFGSFEKSSIQRAAHMTKLESLLNRPLTRLSAGELQRVGFARALIANPEVYLLDEAFSELDFQFQELVVGILKNLAASGKNILLVSHDLEFLRKLGGTRYSMQSGSLVQA